MCINYFFSVEPRKNLIYTFISFLVLSISVTAVYLIGRYGSLNDRVRNFRIDAKTILVQSSLLMLLLISAVICYINILAIRNYPLRVHVSDLTGIELQLRNTAENRGGRAFDFLGIMCYLCSIIGLSIS